MLKNLLASVAVAGVMAAGAAQAATEIVVQYPYGQGCSVLVMSADKPRRGMGLGS